MVRKSYRILVIDDDHEVTEIIKSFLSGAGFEVLVENSPVMGVEKAKTFRPDIILLDLIMPVMDGYEVCSAIKKDIMLSNIPVLILSGKDKNEDDGRGFRCGADLFIKKPFSCERLLQMVKMILTSVAK
jgi:DNA-binding response OmpR family regulator